MAVGGGDQLRHLRRQETLQPPDALDLAQLFLDPLLQRPVPVLQLVGLFLQFCGLLLHGGVRGREFAALGVDFRKQPRIAHRQHRLMREGLHQPDQVGRKLAGHFAQHHQRAQDALLVDQRHHQHRMEAGLQHDIAQPVPGGAGQIGDRDRLALRRGRAEHAVGLVDDEMVASGRLVDADRLGEVELMLCRVVAVDQHRVGMGDLQRARRHRRQHRVEVERGGHRAADFLQHLEFVDRARQIPRPRLDLGFEAGIGFLQLAGHAVELVGQFLQLVPRAHLDAMAEIAGAEPPCACAQRGDRDQHPPRQHGAGEDSDHEAEPDQQRAAHQLVADRRQRQRGRLLEQRMPAEFRQRARCRQHPLAVEAGAGGERHAVRLQEGRDLRQRGEFVADLRALRARQHLAARIDQEGVADLADLGLAEEIVEKAQVDLGQRDAGIDAGMRHRDRHEGAGADEIGRREGDAPGVGLDEADVAGKVAVAVGHHLGARHPQQFAAAAADEGELAHRRQLVQQLRIIGAAILQGAVETSRGRTGARHPADLPLQLVDRLLDPPRGGLRLLAHGLDQRDLGAAIADPGLHRAVDRQHEHDKPDQRDDVFGEQPFAQKPGFVLDRAHPDPRAPPPSEVRAQPALSSTIWRPRTAPPPAWLAVISGSYPPLEGEGRRESGDAKHRPESGGVG